MNVLITTGIYPPAIGGPATHIAQIASELRGRGHEVAVVTLAEDRTEDRDTMDRDVIQVSRGRLRPWRMARTIAAIVRAGRGRDVLYVQGLWIEAAIANLILRKPAARKIVGDWAWERAYGRGWVDDRFDEFQQRAHGGRVRLLKLVRAVPTRRADRVIVPSEYLRGCVLRWGVAPARVVVIENAVDDTSEPVAGVPREPARIISVGRLTRWKGFEQVIAAVEGLADTRLVIVGDGPERARLEAVARQGGAADRIEFRGRLPRAQVLQELAAASAFVLNSAYEGFPHVVLEAFQAGAPVVAADAGGIAEIVADGENGLLVPQGDVAAIRAALGRILGDVALAARLRAGGRQTLDRFTPQRMIERLEQQLAAIVARRVRPAVAVA